MSHVLFAGQECSHFASQVGVVVGGGGDGGGGCGGAAGACAGAGAGAGGPMFGNWVAVGSEWLGRAFVREYATGVS